MSTSFPGAAAPSPHAEQLSALGWDDAWADAAAAYPGHVSGRVVRVDRSGCLVLAADGPEPATLSGAVLARLSADPLTAPCTGDWVTLRRWCDARVTVEHVLERRTLVSRAEAGERKEAQPLAANLTRAAVVVGLDRLPALARVERTLALAWASGAPPMILLTKADQVTDADQIAQDVRAIAPDVPVQVVSARSGQGMDALRSEAGRGRTLALLGASGVGKSSLVNALVGTEVLGTRAIRADGRGRHTTVRRELVLVPGGGCVIDTPGLRGVGLLAGDVGLERTFGDVAALAGACRFRDCSHQGEPGCAVLAAVDTGDLPVRRLESWRALQREQRWISARDRARQKSPRGRRSH